MGTTPALDTELIARVRGGDDAAFRTLCRRHEGAVLRLAATYPEAGPPDDLVAGALAAARDALRHGGGPEVSFRVYLFAVVRGVVAERVAAAGGGREVARVPEGLRGSVAPIDDAERAAILAAYATLADHTQAVLWQTAVEDRPAGELAPRLAVAPPAAAALAARAAGRLRLAYAHARLVTPPEPGCEPHRSRLVADAVGATTGAIRTATRAHLAGCGACRELVSALADVDRRFAPAVARDVAAAAPLAATRRGEPAIVRAARGLVREAAAWAPGREGLRTPAAAIAAVAAAVLAFTLAATEPRRDPAGPGRGDGPGDEVAAGRPRGDPAGPGRGGAPGDAQAAGQPRGDPAGAARGGADLDGVAAASPPPSPGVPAGERPEAAASPPSATAADAGAGAGAASPDPLASGLSEAVSDVAGLAGPDVPDLDLDLPAAIGSDTGGTATLPDLGDWAAVADAAGSLAESPAPAPDLGLDTAEWLPDPDPDAARWPSWPDWAGLD